MINYMIPAVTAFDKNGNVDKKGNQNIYEHLIDGGVSGIVILGSSGEFYSMTQDQKKELIDIASDTIQNRTRFLVGTSGMIVEEVIELSNYALEKGAEAVMIVPPYYFAYEDESIINFYDLVVPKINGNVFLYNFPDRTGYDISPSVTLELLRKHKNITGYKDTIATMGHTRELLETVRYEFPDFEVYAGFDENFFHSILSGGAGNISALGNIAPKLTSSLVSAMESKDIDKIQEAQLKINKLMEIYAIHDSFISTIKHAMVLCGVEIDTYCIAPTLPLNEKKMQHLKDVLKNNGLLD